MSYATRRIFGLLMVDAATVVAYACREDIDDDNRAAIVRRALVTFASQLQALGEQVYKDAAE